MIASTLVRQQLLLKGRVQGVGFRPFVYSLAKRLFLKGWVRNSSEGVEIEVEGEKEKLKSFLLLLDREKPVHAFFEIVRQRQVPTEGDLCTTFTIESSTGSKKGAIVMPDLATCKACLQELFDSTNRRYRYPFINCTHCGPRYSILQRLPYDRCHTTMAHFSLCAACHQEYCDPSNRRFHAQPNACPVCGPQLALWDRSGSVSAEREEAFCEGIRSLQRGEILAVKGIGGFQLLVDATNDGAIERLRSRKRRLHKPFALLIPNLEGLNLSPEEKSLITASQAPIVLIKKSAVSLLAQKVAPDVAPSLSDLGLFLPYTPLHHLLMAELQVPLVATSGNLSGESIAIDEKEALDRLGVIADRFLVHNRPIARAVDDSVVQLVQKKPMVLRRARGYAPLPFSIGKDRRTIQCVGGQQKNTTALVVEGEVYLSQHIGDLEFNVSYESFVTTMGDLQKIYEAKPNLWVCDLHPNYSSTRFAEQTGASIQRVQHHHAHVVSCMVEHGLKGRVLGLVWDGSGYGPDRTIWGGEFLVCNRSEYHRLAHLRPFALPGSEKAIKEPFRVALSLLYAIWGDAIFEMQLPPLLIVEQFPLLQQILSSGPYSPLTSSMGRLFDGVASLIGICHTTSYEGQAAMELEAVAEKGSSTKSYPFCIDQGVIDWEPMVRVIVDEVLEGRSRSEIARRFHHTLVEIGVRIAIASKEKRILLTGGCFQNRLLCEQMVLRLRQEGLIPYWHQAVPPNDGGIALGQAAVAIATKEDKCV